MEADQGSKTPKQDESPQAHHHIWDLPKSIFPRTKKNNAKKYAEDIVQQFQSLSYTNRKLQESAMIALFHIKSISTKSGYSTSPSQVFSSVQDFVYHYENFCSRTYSLREKILQFINAVVPIGYSDRDVNIRHMIINPIVKASGILVEIEKFNKRKALGRVVQDRQSLTHRLYFTSVDHYLRPINGPKQGPEWFKSWSKEVVGRAKLANTAMMDLSDLNHGLSDKIMRYKQTLNDQK